MKIVEMIKDDINLYVDLFISVFNDEPWCDHWTKETAGIRIQNMMDTKSFVGKAVLVEEKIIGLIWGQKEQFYDGVHFQVQEFCIKSELQGNGYGTILLDALRNSLVKDNITNIYLITSKGERTEGFYLSKGFETSSNMILMSRVLN